MLVLSRQRDETIMIGDDIAITVVDIRGDKVRLGITAPTKIAVHRKEVYEAIKAENQRAATVAPPLAGQGESPGRERLWPDGAEPGRLARWDGSADGHRPAPADGPDGAVDRGQDGVRMTGSEWRAADVSRAGYPPLTFWHEMC